MALPKTLARVEEKLDQVLGRLDEIAALVSTDDEGWRPAVAVEIEYDKLTADAIIKRAPSFTPAERAALYEYETRGKARKTVLDALGVS